MYPLSNKAREIMMQAGFYPSELILDGRIHRFKVQPTDTKKNGWYVAHLKGDHLFLVFNDWSRGTLPQKFVVAEDHVLGSFTEESRSKYAKELKELTTKSKVEERIRNETAAIEARKIWDLSLITESHPYLKKKGLTHAFGARLSHPYLIVPIKDIDDKLWGLQKISADGQKLFLSGSKKRGCFYQMGNIIEEFPLIICEGFATGASLYELTGLPTFVAFDAGNLKNVAKALRKKYERETVLFAADNDESNVGLNQAVKAAESIAGRSHILIADFKDFNDLHIALGTDEARRQILHMIDSLYSGRDGLWKNQR